MQTAFVAVSEAEKAGANVTGLLGRLNDGADLLAQANVAYRVGDISGALDKAAGVFAIVRLMEVATGPVFVFGGSNGSNECLRKILYR